MQKHCGKLRGRRGPRRQGGVRGLFDGAVAVGANSEAAAGNPVTGTDVDNLAIAVGNDPVGVPTLASAGSGNFKVAVAFGNPGPTRASPSSRSSQKQRNLIH